MSDLHDVQGLTADQVWTKLVSLEQQLRDIGEGSYDQRVTLREQRQALRARASELSRLSGDPDQLRQELEHLRDYLRDIFDTHMSVGHMGGAGGHGGGGIEPRFVFQLNDAIDQGWDRAGVEARIGEIESALARRDQ